MFTIRKEMKDTFDADIRRRFENRMVEHGNRFFPQQCRELGEAGVRDWIRLGIARAGRYGIVAERDVCKYIDVMFVYGANFDSDSRYPWAAEILNAAPVNPTHKTDRLFETARLYAPARGHWHA